MELLNSRSVAATVAQCSGRPDGAQSSLRHPVRAGADRPGDGTQPVLPGASRKRHDQRAAQRARGLSRGEGRGRLGCGLHRRLLDPPELGRHAFAAVAAVGRGRRAQPRADDRGGSPARRAGRGRAVAWRRVGDEPGEPAAVAVAVRCRLAADLCRLHVQRPPQGHGRRRHQGPAALAGGGCQTRAAGRLRHRLRLCRDGLPALPVPPAGIQSAHGCLWRQPGEPRPPDQAAARGDQGRCRPELRRGVAGQSRGAARPAGESRRERGARAGGAAR